MCPLWVSGGASPAQDRRGQAGTGQMLGQIFGKCPAASGPIHVKC